MFPFLWFCAVFLSLPHTCAFRPHVLLKGLGWRPQPSREVPSWRCRRAWAARLAGKGAVPPPQGPLAPRLLRAARSRSGTSGPRLRVAPSSPPASPSVSLPRSQRATQVPRFQTRLHHQHALAHTGLDRVVPPAPMLVSGPASCFVYRPGKTSGDSRPPSPVSALTSLSPSTYRVCSTVQRFPGGAHGLHPKRRCGLSRFLSVFILEMAASHPPSPLDLKL